MAWWHRVLFPVKKAWVAVSAKVKAAGRKDGGGILKLHNDVETCGYQDVQVMWEMMLRRSEKGLTLTHHHHPSSSSSSSKPTNKKPLWRLSTSSNRRASCGSIQPHHNI
ncbi:uncharacterized protein LOC109841349 [Asparagus officinalis]|uniref:uncharacterized protein LOC109841349 n=1 Tax=Asparagus officinalis TaxID=4686 RepID=UPI00098E5349|nr:uncharacterized protein LOC109841349 [Asparagus officinalis]